jgi:hypothetical protein
MNVNRMLDIHIHAIVTPQRCDSPRFIFRMFFTIKFCYFYATIIGQ